MKAYGLMFLIGVAIGGAAVYSLFPKIVTNDIIKEREKVVTVTRVIKGKDGVITKETTKTENKVIDTPQKIVRYNLLGVTQSYQNVTELQYSRRIFANTFVTLGIDTKKDIKAGILVEF